MGYVTSGKMLAPWGPMGLNAKQSRISKEAVMSISAERAAKVAKLARIHVERNELPALSREFNAILEFIEQLGEVDVKDVEPMTSVTPMRLKRREDKVTDGGMQGEILSNAPDAREGFFAVPKVVE